MFTWTSSNALTLPLLPIEHCLYATVLLFGSTESITQSLAVDCACHLFTHVTRLTLVEH